MKGSLCRPCFKETHNAKEGDNDSGRTVLLKNVRFDEPETLGRLLDSALVA